MSSMLDLTKNRYSSQWRAENASDDLEYAYELGYREAVAAIKEKRQQKAPAQDRKLMEMIPSGSKVGEGPSLSLFKEYQRGQSEARKKMGLW